MQPPSFSNIPTYLILVMICCNANAALSGKILYRRGERGPIPSQTGKVDYSIVYADGSYEFGYDTVEFVMTGDADQQSFRQEARNVSKGSVDGVYGFLNPDNSLKVINYAGGKDGFSTASKVYRLPDSGLADFLTGYDRSMIVGPLPYPSSLSQPQNSRRESKKRNSRST